MNDTRPTITVTRCDDCVHRDVCNYKDDFHAICNAIAGANVHDYIGGGKVKITNILSYKDILDDVNIKCKHYRKDFDHIPPC